MLRSFRRYAPAATSRIVRRISASTTSANSDSGTARAATAWPWQLPTEQPTDDGVYNEAGVNVYVGKNYEQFKSNWAENVEYDHAHFVTPATVEELQEVVANANKVGIVGSGHSFGDQSRVPGGTLIQTAYLNRIDEIDAENMTVTCGAGATVGEICRFLHKRGAALTNTASLPQVTIGGAIATGTHGTGPAFPSLHGNVAALKLVTADGSIRTLQRGRDELFNAAVVGLGSLGIITEVTLDILPEFQINQRVYGGIAMDGFEWEDAFRSGDNVGALVDFGAREVVLLHVRDRVEVGSEVPSPLAEDYGGTLVTGELVAFESHGPLPTTSSGAWLHHQHFFMSGEESSFRDVSMTVKSLQVEFFVDMKDVAPAIDAVAEVAAQWPGWGTWDEVNPETQGVAHICEVRTIKGDDCWLSPCYGRDSVSIHFTLGAFPEEVHAVVKEFGAALKPFGARPHWGKLWIDSVIDEEYPMASAFKAARAELDPDNKFCNGFVERALKL